MFLSFSSFCGKFSGKLNRFLFVCSLGIKRLGLAEVTLLICLLVRGAGGRGRRWVRSGPVFCECCFVPLCKDERFLSSFGE